MLTKTAQGYFSDGKPIAKLLGETEAQKLTRYLDEMSEFSDKAQLLINQRSFDVCVLRGVILPPPDFEDIDF